MFTVRPMPIGTRYALLGDMTPADVVKAGRDMLVGCGTCRMSRTVSVAELAKWRPTQPIRAMVFRCRVCGQAGTASVEGHEDGYRVRYYAERPGWVKDEDWAG